MTTWELVTADVLDWAASYDGPKFHVLLSDPPYELGFMGKKWDASGIAFQPETWTALAEHLHPGAFGMAFASSRGWHRLAVAIEDAGMVIQPSIFGWANGQSFPKATRIKAKSREWRWAWLNRLSNWILKKFGRPPRFALQSLVWAGHRYGGQILKNALEPIIVFQKPWENKRLDCIVETGAGAMWVDGGRVSSDGDHKRPYQPTNNDRQVYGKQTGFMPTNASGRWPANFTLTHHPDCRRIGTRRVRGTGTAVHRHGTTGTWGTIGTFEPGALDSTYADPDGYETITAWDCVPECPVRRLGEMSGERQSKRSPRGGQGFHNCLGRPDRPRMDGNIPSGYDDTGTAARFYFQACWSFEIAERLALTDPVMYCPKASRKERDAGLEKLPLQERPGLFDDDDYKWNDDGHKVAAPRRNPHPTVKPIALTRWLATLLLPPPEYAPRRLLIPFSGSGSEGIGAGLAGWEKMTLIDFKAKNNEIAEARLQHWLNRRQLELGI